MPDTAPSPGLLRRLLGGPISQDVQQEWPELAKQWASHEMRMPKETTKATKVKPMNWLERMMHGNAYAITRPWNTIALNRPAIEQDKIDLGDVLTHELTHVGQTPGFLGYFGSRAKQLEDEAMRSEMTRKRPRDINLPLEASPNMLNKMVSTPKRTIPMRARLGEGNPRY